MVDATKRLSSSPPTTRTTRLKSIKAIVFYFTHLIIPSVGCMHDLSRAHIYETLTHGQVVIIVSYSNAPVNRHILGMVAQLLYYFGTRLLTRRYCVRNLG